MKTLKRCSWAGDDPLMTRYHDEQWGVPVHDDRVLFEMLTLEGAQAGLSWSTILNKREGYRNAFARFDPAKVARFTARDRARLVKDDGIVRNVAKIESTVKNAQAFLKLQKEFGSFDAYLWAFVDGAPVQGKRRASADVPASTALADGLSKDLKKRGFGFVGPTIVYAFLQAVGVVNDHLTTCFRYKELARGGRRV
ncbi:MAG TPA: DNA-3-methyladenine glycosylase I [Polyangiaceae bacterium]|nr:DNA-3-methyladenine glycosylase I [Polyangiaceae bacterium]